LNKLDEQVLQVLNESGYLTLVEIADKINKKPKAVFGSLRRLFENGDIKSDPKTHRYSIAEKEQ
jgi:DNA-binding Lrp family transcriptional regulator